jgi:N-acetylglutamate synthase-like GNAT family acetyltransferase
VTDQPPSLLAFPLAEWEREGLSAVLAKAGLAAGDVPQAGALFWRFESEDVPVGFGGVEMHGDHALLRAVVTLPPMRHRGIGRGIVTSLERQALALGGRTIWLLTSDAAGFALKLGYGRRERTEIPDALRDTPLFASPSAADAQVMMKRL